MAAAKYDWGDGLGKVHSISLAQHKLNVAAANAPKGKGAPGTPIVPPGTYDPSLDASEGQVNRGLINLVGEAPNTATGSYGGTTGRDIQRATEDFLRQGGYVQSDYDTGVARENQLDQRSLDDLIKSGQRETADYGTNTANLQRSYTNLGAQQNAGARKAGVALGGAIQQAMDKRAANQAIDQSAIDVAHQRAQEDVGTAQTRLGEDQTYNLGQLQTTRDRQIGPNGELRISTQRTVGDLGDTARQAITEAGFSTADIEAAKRAQFEQMYPGATLPGLTTGSTASGTSATTPTATAPRGNTLTAAPGAPGVTTTRKKKGKNTVVTYGNSVVRP